MRSRRIVGAAIAALVFTFSAAPGQAHSVAIDADLAAARAAVSWLKTQQQPDGGFEVAEFPGFETPEAVAAIAAVSQASGPWSGRSALQKIQSVQTPEGETPLDYLDEFASAEGDDAISGGSAARLITLVTSPLCLNPEAFDPSGDGATDLLGTVHAAERDNGAYGPEGVFSDTLWAVLALVSVGETVSAKTVAFIREAQEADGGWNYLGSSADQGFDDIDTTALAIQALLAVGASSDDAAIAKAFTLLRDAQSDDGSWSFFGSADPNATAVAWLAFRAAGTLPDHDALGFLRSQQADDGRVKSPNDSFGVNTFATSQATRAWMETALPVPVTAGSCAGEGYTLIAADGGVLTFGSGFHGSAGDLELNAPIVGGAVTATGLGYYLFARDGGVFTYGDATYHGSQVGHDSAIVGGDVEPTGDGYRLFSGSGAVHFQKKNNFPRIQGSPSHLNAPVVAGAATSSTGTLLFAGDGGVFASGDARFYGSMGAVTLNAPIVGGAATPSGRGYVLFAADGGVFTFGDARFLGSMGATPLRATIIGGSVSPTGNGYVLFAADGGVFTFGDVEFEGSAATIRLNAPVVGGAID